MAKQIIYISERLIKAGPGLPALPKAGGAPKAGGDSGGSNNMEPCPLGGGEACIAAGGNGADQHKAGGSIMRAHQEYQARAGKQSTKQNAQQQEASKDPLKAGKPVEQQQSEANAAFGKIDQAIDKKESQASYNEAQGRGVLNKLDEADKKQEDSANKQKQLLSRLSTEHGGIQGKTNGDVVADKLRSSSDSFLNNTGELQHADTSPMAHYRASNIARKLGKEDVAQFHQDQARKKTDKFTPEQHAELANKLEQEGMDYAMEHAKHHKEQASQKLEEDLAKEPVDQTGGPIDPDNEDMKEKFVPGYKKEKYSKKLNQNAREAQKRAIKDFSSASEKYTKDTENLKKLNEGYEKDLQEYSKKRDELTGKLQEMTAKLKEARKSPTEGKGDDRKKNVEAKKKAVEDLVNKIAEHKQKMKEHDNKKPEKPKQDIEEPELKKPKGAMEEARHQEHTSRARDLADKLSAHLSNRDDLSDEDRSKLEKLHSVAEYHANIQHHPTSQNKSELREAERMAKQHGADKSHAEHAADTKAKQQDVADREKATNGEGEEDQGSEEELRKPSNTLEQRKLDNHKSQAQQLISAFQSHIKHDPKGKDVQMLQQAIQDLQAHTSLEHMPTKEQMSQLQQYKKEFGEYAKIHPNENPEESAPNEKTQSATKLLSRWNAGMETGTEVGNIINDPYGGAGRMAATVGKYGGRGVVSAGHALLADEGNDPQKAKPTHQATPGVQSAGQQQQNQQQAAQPIKQSSVGNNNNKVQPQNGNSEQQPQQATNNDIPEPPPAKKRPND